MSHQISIAEVAALWVPCHVRHKNCRNDLLDMCGERFLAKKGRKDALQEKLALHWFHRAKAESLKAWAAWALGEAEPAEQEIASSSGQCAEPSKPAAPENEMPPPTSSSSAAAEDKTQESKKEQPAAAAAASSSKSSGSGGSGGQSSKSHKKENVFGDSHEISEPLEDLSNHWTDPKAGPELPDEAKLSTEDVINAADGIVPVAAMVKILQSLEENAYDVSLLLAGLRVHDENHVYM